MEVERVFLESFDDKNRAQTYRQSVVEEMRRNQKGPPEYRVGLEAKRVGHQLQWWVMLTRPKRFSSYRSLGRRTTPGRPQP